MNDASSRRPCPGSSLGCTRTWMPIGGTGASSSAASSVIRPRARSRRCSSDHSAMYPARCRTARRNAAPARPPTHSGGIGPWGWIGGTVAFHGAPSVASRPVNSAGSAVSSASVRRPRSDTGTPAAAHSAAISPPTPTPNSTRPPDTACSELICLPTQAGWRSAAIITAKPIRRRSLTAAAVVAATTLSRMGALATRWSPIHTLSRPTASADRTVGRMSRYPRPNPSTVGSWMPKEGASTGLRPRRDATLSRSGPRVAHLGLQRPDYQDGHHRDEQTEQREREPEREQAVPRERTDLEEEPERTGLDHQRQPDVEVAEPARERGVGHFLGQQARDAERDPAEDEVLVGAHERQDAELVDRLGDLRRAVRAERRRAPQDGRHHQEDRHQSGGHHGERPPYSALALHPADLHADDEEEREDGAPGPRGQDGADLDVARPLRVEAGDLRRAQGGVGRREHVEQEDHGEAVDGREDQRHPDQGYLTALGHRSS